MRIIYLVTLSDSEGSQFIVPSKILRGVYPEWILRSFHSLRMTENEGLRMTTMKHSK